MEVNEIKHRKTTERFREELRRANPDLDLLGEYLGAKTKAVVKNRECGHEWEALPTNLLRGSGCPFCSGMLPVPGETDLATVNPDLAAQWHPTKNGDLTPADVKAGSINRVWWICSEGHKWEATVSGRSQGSGCPYCSNRRALAGYNDLATIDPDLAAQWSPRNETKPDGVLPSSGVKAWWVCGKGHEWEATIASRHAGRGCPYCSNQRVLPGYNDLTTVDPHLAREWSSRNDRSPDEVVFGSPKSVWWQCEHGHEWKASIKSRHLGHGCPYCSGQRAIPGQNDLATLNPDLAAQWHPTKNGDLTPSGITASSSKKVWWQCEKGHEWRATVYGRHKNGCPYCSGHKVLAGFNDLATVNPGLAAQWHPAKNGALAPTGITAGSGKKVWWIGECGHEWEAVVCDRSAGTGCPYCSNEKVLAGFNDLESQFPDIASQWHPTKNGNAAPNEVLAASTKEYWWQCGECGHEWEASLAYRTCGWSECPSCKVKMRGTSFPEQALLFYLRRDSGMVVEHRAKVPCFDGSKVEVDIWIPSLNTGVEYDGIFYHEGRKGKDAEKASLLRGSGIRLVRVVEGDHLEIDGDDVFFDIKSNPRAHQRDAFEIVYGILGFEAKSTFDLVTDRFAILEQYKKEAVANSLAALAPEVAAQWDFEKNGSLAPGNVSVSSNLVVYWKCEHGHSWEAMVNDRTNGNGCPYCSGRFAIAGENDLATVNPDLAAQWHPTRNGDLSPSDVKPGSGKKVWWICGEGHEWEAKVYDRTKGNGCPYCSGRRIKKGVNDLATTRPNLAAQWSPRNDVSPEDVSASSGKKVWWQCERGHEWEAPVSNRSKGSGCPYCAGLIPIPGENDLATVNPDLAAQWHPTKNGSLLPSDVKPGSGKKVWWQCKFGHEWEAVVRDRHQRGNGCPYCSGKRLIPGVNDLATIDPDLAQQWHPTRNGDLIPADVKPNSNRDVWWQCKYGHVWKARISHRHNGLCKCPICRN